MRITLIFMLVAFASCQTKNKPKEVLSKEQLSALLVDIYLAEARMENIPVSGAAGIKDSTIRYFIPYEEKIMKKYGVSDSILKKTYAYYLDNPKELEQIYDAVIDTLALREQKLNLVPHRPGENKLKKTLLR